MSHSNMPGVIMTLSGIAAAVFIYVTIHEFGYASDHPYAYGPAHVIAWGAVAGTLLAIAVGLIGYALTQQASRGSRT